MFLAGQSWCPNILFIATWPLHFEIHFAGSEGTTLFIESLHAGKAALPTEGPIGLTDIVARNLQAA